MTAPRALLAGRSRLAAAWQLGTLALVAAVAVANLIATARRTPPPPLATPAGPSDPVAQTEARFAPLRAALRALGAPDRLGYVGDLPAAQLLADPQGCADYYRAQFALAPRVLDLADGPQVWIVANLRTAAAASRVPAGWTLAHDFGGGLLLLKARTP